MSLSLPARLAVTIAMIFLVVVLYDMQYGHAPEPWAYCAAAVLGWLCTSPHYRR